MADEASVILFIIGFRRAGIENRVKYAFRACVCLCTSEHLALRTLRSEDGDGSENVTERVNSRSYNLHRDYFKSLTFSNVGEPS